MNMRDRTKKLEEASKVLTEEEGLAEVKMDLKKFKDLLKTSEEKFHKKNSKLKALQGHRTILEGRSK